MLSMSLDTKDRFETGLNILSTFGQKAVAVAVVFDNGISAVP